MSKNFYCSILPHKGTNKKTSGGKAACLFHSHSEQCAKIACCCARMQSKAQQSSATKQSNGAQPTPVK